MLDRQPALSKGHHNCHSPPIGPFWGFLAFCTQATHLLSVAELMDGAGEKVGGGGGVGACGVQRAAGPAQTSVVGSYRGYIDSHVRVELWRQSPSRV